MFKHLNWSTAYLQFVIKDGTKLTRARKWTYWRCPFGCFTLLYDISSVRPPHAGCWLVTTRMTAYIFRFWDHNLNRLICHDCILGGELDPPPTCKNYCFNWIRLQINDLKMGGHHPFSSINTWATKKPGLTLHYTGCLIGILIMVYEIIPIYN